MHLVSPAKPVAGRLVCSQVCTNGKSNSFVRHIAIDVSGTPLEGNFLVGQSFGVRSAVLHTRLAPLLRMLLRASDVNSAWVAPS